MEKEYPSEEWEIEEYPQSVENKSKLSWIFNMGLGLGKKIVVTGIVISSAPLVLPPLVVISALGFAFSVPFGLIFASYAFTEKLMRKLFPGTNHPPLLLDYGMLSEEEEEEQEIDDLGLGGEICMEKEKEEDMGDLGFGGEFDMERKEGVNDWGFGGEIDMEKEEEEGMEDTRGGVEMGIELPEENDDYRHMNEGYEEDVKESVKEEGYEEDVGEYLDLNSKQALGGIDVKIEGMREEGEEGPEIEESKDDQYVVPRVVVLFEGDETNNENVSEVKELIVVSPVFDEEGRDEGKVIGDEEELVRENEGLFEKVGEDRNFGNGYIENERMEESPKTKNVKLQKLVTEVEGTEEERKDGAVPDENDEEELKRETTGLLEKIRDEDNVDNTVEKEKNVGRVGESDTPSEDKNGKFEKPIGEIKGTEEMREKEFSKENGEMPERNDKENVNVLPKEVKVVGEIENITEGNREEKNVDNVLVVEKPIGESNGRKPEGFVESIVEEEQKPSIDEKGAMQGMEAKDLHMEKEKESEINSITDPKKGANEHHAAPRNEKATDNKKENADLKEFPETKNSGIASGKDTVVSSNEVLLTEEKIWEQIDAMRTIVGYKAAIHATCMEELKALYIFTGVELPASFKDKADLVEVNAKLRFLMSVVGVK